MDIEERKREVLETGKRRSAAKTLYGKKRHRAGNSAGVSFRIGVRPWASVVEQPANDRMGNQGGSTFRRPIQKRQWIPTANTGRRSLQGSRSTAARVPGYLSVAANYVRVPCIWVGC